MTDLVHFAHVVVPSVFIPAAVFGGNWAIRYRSEYTQTAASDFILAVLIFDGAVIATVKDFEPFIQNSILKEIAVPWHIVLGTIGMFLWWLIATFAEPIVASHYSNNPQRVGGGKFFFTILICWISVFILISAHITFFMWNGGNHG